MYLILSLIGLLWLLRLTWKAAAAWTRYQQKPVEQSLLKSFLVGFADGLQNPEKYRKEMR